jgi:hypothetical protein
MGESSRFQGVHDRARRRGGGVLAGMRGAAWAPRANEDSLRNPDIDCQIVDSHRCSKLSKLSKQRIRLTIRLDDPRWQRPRRRSHRLALSQHPLSAHRVDHSIHESLDVGIGYPVSLLSLRSRAIPGDLPAIRVQALSRRLPTDSSVAFVVAGWHSRGGVFGSLDVGTRQTPRGWTDCQPPPLVKSGEPSWIPCAASTRIPGGPSPRSIGWRRPQSRGNPRFLSGRPRKPRVSSSIPHEAPLMRGRNPASRPRLRCTDGSKRWSDERGS